MSAATKSFRVDDLLVQIYNTEAEMAENAAKIAQEYLYNLLQQQDQVALLLATGNSQLKFLDALIALGGLDWSRIALFHLDEYLGITADHPASFRHYLRERVEQRVSPQRFYYIEGDTLEPVAECDRYTKLLKAQPIDLCFLGIGENGHLAFNDPAVADFQDPASVKLVKLDQVNRQQQVNTGYFSNLETVPQYAFTLTIPIICAAKKIICLAPDIRKAKIVKEILQSPITTNRPASILRKQPQATLFLDTNSAQLLS
ncbi:glucosamine-6-phosphate deaminase [Anabaena cylindrica FACHB-243]|uniref:Glucosamine-6-phosphate deaminase n=1 Tax=Anabaena cylindrica (strain ATCC 27899 / PCC 7122) TaxID=272123 RepID=K9ZGV1_ANACC|nr:MULTISPECIES: glucosamine-6-phosphate deaminase [Anabaena]AFZ58463.1 Glucosamine-6-phosphate deaminase [Anabaena cylindrica PCC 7122]MBD2417314.1 glucosamine-6-phosphate deaminase [Anabaena cylindrica FACHB-243]MBY5282422.1 glucosamine-6-phosphate deaminase [Anabaena sp. CCAP 1446/1C]MBY5308779.1 glucosamine-6-phosphate deaminase [Anabaena sp. CCAP 1446/1C]MCM2410123.1 glucosamine-6-phosphate deaminase [Anabaena sp. CCAP 1446/1C]